MFHFHPSFHFCTRYCCKVELLFSSFFPLSPTSSDSHHPHRTILLSPPSNWTHIPFHFIIYTAFMENFWKKRKSYFIMLLSSSRISKSSFCIPYWLQILLVTFKFLCNRTPFCLFLSISNFSPEFTVLLCKGWFLSSLSNTSILKILAYLYSSCPFHFPCPNLTCQI